MTIERRLIFSPRRAFTLLELLLVLLLIGVSAATIVPRLNGTLGRWQCRETAQNLEAILRLGSEWARIRQEPIAFVLSVARGSFGLRLLGDEQELRGRIAPPVGWQSVGQGVRITRTEGLEDRGDDRVLVFWPNGASQAADIILTGDRSDANRETVWQIAVDGRGAVRCQERPVDDVDG